ncbi:MAG TPA: hypothetical protein VM580_30925 [Labilithrix sp.]|nr:hypothetical protein [Labilithrix sp.]
MSLRRLGVASVFAALVSSALPACTATANVSDVWTSIDEDGSRRRNLFFTDTSRITCVAEVGVGRKDVTVELRIRQIRRAQPGTRDFQEVNAVLLDKDFHPGVTADGPATVALSMLPTSIGTEGKVQEDDEAPFVAGSYVCEVLLDGKQEGKSAFNIDYAPCPATVIQTGTACVGFYPLAQTCPLNGATGQPEPTCKCEQNGWTCP